MNPRIFVLNGPNLNLLGKREPHIYGYTTMADVEQLCREAASKHNADIDFRQSNYEGQMVEWIHEAREEAQAIVINAGAYTHTSVAIHDALKSFNGLKVELHISNPHLREPFRHISYVSSAADSISAGLGFRGYPLVVDLVAKKLAAAT